MYSRAYKQYQNSRNLYYNERQELNSSRKVRHPHICHNLPTVGELLLTAILSLCFFQYSVTNYMRRTVWRLLLATKFITTTLFKNPCAKRRLVGDCSNQPISHQHLLVLLATCKGDLVVAPKAETALASGPPFSQQRRNFLTL